MAITSAASARVYPSIIHWAVANPAPSLLATFPALTVTTVVNASNRKVARQQVTNGRQSLPCSGEGS